jgi:hypothetical protein
LAARALGSKSAWQQERLAARALGSKSACQQELLAARALGSNRAWQQEHLAAIALGSNSAWQQEQLATRVLGSESAWQRERLAARARLRPSRKCLEKFKKNIFSNFLRNFFREIREKTILSNFCILTSFFTFLEVFHQIFPNSTHF